MEIEERKKVGVKTQIPDTSCNEELSKEGMTRGIPVITQIILSIIYPPKLFYTTLCLPVIHVYDFIYQYELLLVGFLPAIKLPVHVHMSNIFYFYFFLLQENNLFRNI